MDDLNIVGNCKTRKNVTPGAIILLGKSKTRSGGFKRIRRKKCERIRAKQREEQSGSVERKVDLLQEKQ